MKKLFRSKKFVGISSLVLATSLVVGTIAIRRSKDGNGFKIGSSTVYADGSLLDYDSASLINYSTILGRAIDYGILIDTLDQKGTFASLTGYSGNVLLNIVIMLLIMKKKKSEAAYDYSSPYIDQPAGGDSDSTYSAGGTTGLPGSGADDDVEVDLSGATPIWNRPDSEDGQDAGEELNEDEFLQ